MRDLGVAEKVGKALEGSHYDALVVVGSDNVQYLGGMALPFLCHFPARYLSVFWPRGGYPTVICPAEWEGTVRKVSWIRRIIPYVEVPGEVRPLVEAIERSVLGSTVRGGVIGADESRASCTLFEELQRALGGYEFAGCDDWLKNLRMEKTCEEVKLLEEAAYRTDHGILGAAHHVLVTSTRSEMSLSEEIRVHCLERELDVVGHHSVSQAASGAHARKLWPLAPKYGLGYDKALREGELVRMEMRSSLDGYWSDASRMLAMGEPTPQQRRCYEGLVALRDAAVRALRPGAKSSDVFRAVREEAARKGVKLIAQMGVGHGVGVTTFEPPFLNEGNGTELKPGVVLVLSPAVYGPDGEMMMSKDTVLVTEAGCRILGWYKDWREPYIAAYTL